MFHYPRLLMLALLVLLPAACNDHAPPPAAGNAPVHAQMFTPSSPAGFGDAKIFNAGWRFYLGEAAGASAKAYDASRWQEIQLPHDWSVKQALSPSLASATGWLPGGIGWYRKTFSLTPEQQGKNVYFYFGGVYQRSEVFVNGHLLGKRPNGYVSFMYEATPYIDDEGENIIAVRVDHSADADSRWYTGSGIYRDVWLVTANPVHIAQWGVYAWPEINEDIATLHVQIDLANDTSKNADVVVLNELIATSGEVIANHLTPATIAGHGTTRLNLALEVDRPLLWSLEHPNLYQLRTTLSRDGAPIDGTLTRTGFRSLTFDPDRGFALNGEWMKVKGVCLHHDSGVLGAEVYPDFWRRRLLTLREMGVNAIRTSHNPQDSSLYDLADELGLLVLNEAFDEWEYPKRKWLQGWNVGTPGFQGMSEFFPEWGERDLADMVRRDRNHVSIFAWSIGNEVDYPNDPYSHPVLDGGAETGFTQPIHGGYKPDAPDARRLGDIAKRLAAVVKIYDTTRPVTAGLAGVAMSNETEYPGVLDIAGYNYTESFYQQDHVRYPQRVIYGSENRHDAAAWRAVTDNAHIFGQFLWTGIDYLGEARAWLGRGMYTGLIDLAGFVKPRGYFRQSLWSDKPMAYLGTYPITPDTFDRAPSMDAWPLWNYAQGQLLRVVAYTNAQQAWLELDGKRVGELRGKDPEHAIIYWDIPYAPGVLELVGVDAGGNEMVRHALRSSKRPHAISIIGGGDAVIARDGDIVQVELQIVDEDGVPVMLSEDEVTVEIVRGNLRLLGMESGSNTDMSDQSDHRHRVFHGRMLVILQAQGAPDGASVVKFSAPWLKSAEAVF